MKYTSKLILNWEEYQFAAPSRWRQPWVNTIAYYPLDSVNTVNDMSWNWYDLTLIWTADFNTYQWVDCFNSQWTWRMECSSLTLADIWNVFSAMAWVYTPDRQDHNERWILWATDNSLWFKWFDLFESYYSWQNQAYRWETLWSSNKSIFVDEPFWQWYHLCLTYEDWTNNQKLYINGVLEWEDTNTMYLSSSAIFRVAARVWVNGSWWVDVIRSWWLSNIILEDKVRTAQEITDYFNQTKSLYGIS